MHTGETVYAVRKEPENQYPKQIGEHSQTAEALCVPFRSLTTLQRVTTPLTSNGIDSCLSPILIPSVTGFVGVNRQGGLSDFCSFGSHSESAETQPLGQVP